MRNAKQDSCLYFAYGSNLHPARLADRLCAPRLLSVARLLGWARHFDKRGRDGTGKCTIVPAEGCVHGAVYVLSSADKARLDVIEGLGIGYDEQTVDLGDFGTAITYLAHPAACEHGLLVLDWYLELILVGGRYLGFPLDELAQIAATPTIPDRDPARAALHARLLAACRSYSRQSGTPA